MEDSSAGLLFLTAPRAMSSIQGYSWCEDDKSVTVYIELDKHLQEGSSSQINDVSQVSLSAEDDTVLVRIRTPENEEWKLTLSPLTGDIDGKATTCKLRRGKVVIKLWKKHRAQTWSTLVGSRASKPKTLSGDISCAHASGLVACLQSATPGSHPLDSELLISKATWLSEKLDHKSLNVGPDTPNLNHFSIFHQVPQAARCEFLQLVLQDPRGERAIGAMVGLAIADSVGHMFEFLDVGERGHHFDHEALTVVGSLNTFNLKKGQWTDDTSMALCMSDSLLVKQCYDGSDIRVRFWNWWLRGYNNAFRLDSTRSSRRSVGLGGNIGDSLDEVGALRGAEPPPRFEKPGSDDAGNGSLMRLAPLPIYFHTSPRAAAEMSHESSLTTHPGKIAADACSFLGYLISQAMLRARDSTDTAAEFLDMCSNAFLTEAIVDTDSFLMKLLRADEPVGSTERNWNWRDKSGPFLKETLAARGDKYNDYPVNPGYFGSYSADCLALALFCIYHTSSFMEAMAKCINFLGDADSTGAVCGQLAGAFYGIRQVDMRLIAALETWDEGEIALRGGMLFALGLQQVQLNRS